jgi:hypothetical protein
LDIGSATAVALIEITASAMAEERFSLWNIVYKVLNPF